MSNVRKAHIIFWIRRQRKETEAGRWMDNQHYSIDRQEHPFSPTARCDPCISSKEFYPTAAEVSLKIKIKREFYIFSNILYFLFSHGKKCWLKCERVSLFANRIYVKFAGRWLREYIFEYILTDIRHLGVFVIYFFHFRDNGFQHVFTSLYHLKTIHISKRLYICIL